MGINIKEPCSEDWYKMTSTEKGAFCQSCAKEVIDFTNKSPNQIKSILADEIANDQNTCGRITNIQMDRINNSFVNWKSDQESFRAVWTLSLVAIFGLTLFSCQNTASKEIVSQMNENGAQMLYQDSIANSTAETETETAQDSSGVAENQNDSIVPVTINEDWNDVIAYDGLISVFEWKFPTDVVGGIGYDPTDIYTECVIMMGDVATSGGFGISQKAEEILIAERNARRIANLKPHFSESATIFIETPPANAPPVPENKPVLDGRIIAIATDGEKDFRAYISPNPIEVSSKLYLLLHELTDVDVKIHLAGSTKVLRSGSITLPEGKHEVDLKLFKFEQGDYDMHVVANTTKRILKFKVS